MQSRATLANQTLIQSVEERIAAVCDKYRAVARQLELKGLLQDAAQIKASTVWMHDVGKQFKMGWTLMEHRRRSMWLEFSHMLQHGRVPFMEYPGGKYLETWSADPLNQAAYRRKVLVDALRVYTHHYRYVVAHHLKDCAKGRPREQIRAATLLQLPEVTAFVEQNPETGVDFFHSGGLLISCSELRNQGPVSVGSASFMPKYVGLCMKNPRMHTVLTHAAGLCHFDKTHPHLHGVSGLLRSICTQLLVDQSSELRLQRVKLGGTEFLEKLKIGDVDSLCNLFRYLLYDVATYAQDCINKQWEGFGPRTITIILDGTNFLEVYDRRRFYCAVDWLRTMVDEVLYGEIGKYLSLRYILIHPEISSLLQCPYPIERPIVLEPQD